MILGFQLKVSTSNKNLKSTYFQSETNALYKQYDSKINLKACLHVGNF